MDTNSLIDEAITKKLGIGGCPTSLLENAQTPERRLKAGNALAHSIGWTAGQFLTHDHLTWRENWKKAISKP